MNSVQVSIVNLVKEWADTETKPITLEYIVEKIAHDEVSKDTIKSSIRSLIKKHYIRKSAVRSSKVSYVLLRNV